MGAHQVDAGALELVERPGLRRGQQPERGVERAGLEAGLRGRQRALAAPLGILGQRHGALQERSRGGEPAASLRPARPNARARRRLPRSGPDVPRARCQARRSGSVSGSVASARARCTRWRSSSAAER